MQHTVTTEVQHRVGSAPRRYFRATCTCGWRSSRSHTTQLALAQGEAHLRGAHGLKK